MATARLSDDDDGVNHSSEDEVEDVEGHAESRNEGPMGVAQVEIGEEVMKFFGVFEKIQKDPGANAFDAVRKKYMETFQIMEEEPRPLGAAWKFLFQMAEKQQHDPVSKWIGIAGRHFFEMQKKLKENPKLETADIVNQNYIEMFEKMENEPTLKTLSSIGKLVYQIAARLLGNPEATNPVTVMKIFFDIQETQKDELSQEILATVRKTYFEMLKKEEQNLKPLGLGWKIFFQLVERRQHDPVSKWVGIAGRNFFEMQEKLEKDPTLDTIDAVNKNYIEMFGKMEKEPTLKTFGAAGKLVFQIESMRGLLPFSEDNESEIDQRIENEPEKFVSGGAKRLEEEPEVPTTLEQSKAVEEAQQKGDSKHHLYKSLIKEFDQKINTMRKLKQDVLRKMEKERKDTLSLTTESSALNASATASLKSQSQVDSGISSSIVDPDDQSVTSEDSQQWKGEYQEIHEWLDTINIEDVDKVDKSQQTDDSLSDPEYPYNMGYPAKTSKVIGPTSGTIELLGYKVEYPPNSLTEEREIELSIDNNPINFPEGCLPITSILEINPSVKLERPAIVTMPTTCRPADGKQTIQIWSKETGQDWQKSETVLLTEKNEIRFETDHFSGKVGTSVDPEASNILITVKYRLYIQKDTGTILSVFWEDDKSMQNVVKECIALGYKRLLPTDQTLTGKLDSEFEIAATCIFPAGIQYSPASEEDPTVFKISAQFLKAKCPQSIRFLPPVGVDLNTATEIRIRYSIDTKAEVYTTKWPVDIIKEDQDGSPSLNAGLQVNVNNKQINTRETAGMKATGGGIVHLKDVASSSTIVG